MVPLSEDTQSEVNKAFNSTTRYLDCLLNIDNTFFNDMVSQIYPLNFSKIRPAFQIPRLHIWTYSIYYGCFCYV